jgi:Eukaryotic-type carbonic anhydrase
MSTAPVQSPIALEIREAEYEDDAIPLEYVGHFDKVGGAAEMINTGTSAMIMLPNRNRKPYITGGPLKDQKFIFEQLHFHWVISKRNKKEIKN